MKNVKTLLLATLSSFMMVTSTMANPISNDADLIFSNTTYQVSDNANAIFSNSDNSVEPMQLAQLSTTEMKETEGAWWFVRAVVSFVASRWSSPAY